MFTVEPCVQRLCEVIRYGSRRKAREYALQMLFQWDITHDSLDQIKANFWEGQDESEETRTFAETLASGSIRMLKRSMS